MMEAPLRSLAGMKVIVSEHATEAKWVWPTPYKQDAKRSRRLVKKLTRKFGPSIHRVPCAYRMGGAMVMHPSIAGELRRQSLQR